MYNVCAHRMYINTKLSCLIMYIHVFSHDKHMNFVYKICDEWNLLSGAGDIILKLVAHFAMIQISSI